MASLVDTNVLVYCFDPRDRHKQRIAEGVLRDGLRDDSLVLPHQAIVELIPALCKPRAELDGEGLLSAVEAGIVAESLMDQFAVVYPTQEVLVTALRGAAAYSLSWFDAHLWAYAEVFGLPEILSEDFAHGRRYGSVRVRDPFLAAAGRLHELPRLYGP